MNSNLVIILGLAIIGGFLLMGVFNPTTSGFANLVIEEIRYAEPTAGPDINEWISIANRTGRPVTLDGWKIESAEANVSPPTIGQTFFFPPGCVLPPGGKIFVHSGPIVGGSASTPCGQLRIHLYPKWRAPQGSPTGWWKGVPEIGNTVWDNAGDIAWLLAPTGGSGLFVFQRVDTCIYEGNEPTHLKTCR